MRNKITEEMEELKIPRGKLQKRLELGVLQAENEMVQRKKNRFQAPRWLINSVASAIILGTTWTVGGSYIADAADSLINQIFGSKEQVMQDFPGESEESLAGLEQELAFTEQHLTEEEFADLTQLAREQIEVVHQMNLENRSSPNEEEEKRLNEIQEKLQAYVKKAEVNE
ncbi:hypothetical protein [Paenisporosarcina sp. TG20]|uniref:hypothetical protein n=1 Tax=Paenisporosarcina sp. TG20 TaxID=1211706 RepID=UPI000314489A|nr:hypothetical protein [Paenisporosarcina sp. TG20]